MTENEEEKKYNMIEIYKDLNYWKDIIQLGGNLLISFNYSDYLSFYEFYQTDIKDASSINISQSLVEMNIKDEIQNISNISRMNDGSILGSINNKIIIIKIKKEGEYIPEPYILKNNNYTEDNKIKNVIELSNGKLLICDQTNKLNICKYMLNKKENTSKSMVKTFFKKISNSMISDNILEKESEILSNFTFFEDTTMIMEITLNKVKLIISQNYEENTLYFYESKGEIYIKKCEINNVYSQYIKEICNGYLLGFSKNKKNKYIELISLQEKKVYKRFEIKNVEKSPISDIIINYKKNQNDQYEYNIILLRGNYLINQILFNPQANIFKLNLENEFIELKNMQKDWPIKIIEFAKAQNENQYILISKSKIYLMNSKANYNWNIILFYLSLFIILLLLLENGDFFDIILYIIIGGISIKLFNDYNNSPNKNNFFKNNELVKWGGGIFVIWILKYIGIFNSIMALLFFCFIGLCLGIGIFTAIMKFKK